VIPSTLAGLALFLVLLAPGLAYVLRHERVVPAQQYSAFRETLRVVFVSVICLTITGLLAAGLRWLAPSETPDIGRLVEDPVDAVREHYVQFTVWVLALIIFATLLGALAADPRVVRLLHRAEGTRVVRWFSGSTDTGIRSVSAWYRVFHIFDGNNPGPVVVGAQMDDGTYVEGRLFSFNATAEEGEDREVLLAAPLYLTTVDGRRHDLFQQFTVISARRIVRLDITHLEPSDEMSTVGPPATDHVADGPPPT
jgi:Family of unknown function (DUF6338)